MLIYLSFLFFLLSLPLFLFPSSSCAPIFVLCPSLNFFLCSGLGQLIAPAVAGLIMSQYGIQYVLLIDVVTCCFGMSTLMMVQFPKMPTNSSEASKSPGNMWEELTFGWRFIMHRQGLWVLLLLFTFSNLISTFVFELIPPVRGREEDRVRRKRREGEWTTNVYFALPFLFALWFFLFLFLSQFLLMFNDEQTLGLVCSFCGIGMVFGGIIVTYFGVPQNRVLGIIVLLAVQGRNFFFLFIFFAFFAMFRHYQSLLLSSILTPPFSPPSLLYFPYYVFLASGITMVTAVMPPSATLIAAVGFVYLLIDPIISSCASDVWMRKVSVSE